MRKIRRTAAPIALVCCVSASACSTRAPSEDVSDSDISAVEETRFATERSPAEQDSSLRATFAAAAVLGRTRSTAIDRLGQPHRILRNPLNNTHVVGQTDTLVSLRYEKLSVTFWVPGDGTPHEIPVGITILPPWPLAVDVPPSAGRRDLVRLWGRPAFVRSVADTAILNWQVWTEDAEEYLQAYLVGNAIGKLRWSFYID